MSDKCTDCGRPLATTAHEQATDGYCCNDLSCLLAQRRQLKEKLAASERSLNAWEQLAEATLAINLPRAFFWKGAKGRCLVRFAGGEAAGGSFTTAAVSLATKLGLLDKADG